jgi:hypothetical protein
MPPLEAFHWVLKNRPSAELQPKSKSGKVTQFDEDQLGRTFRQMDMISHFMLNDRPLKQGERKNSPVEVFQKTQIHEYFKGDDLETLHDRILLSYEKWAHAQFKIHGSPIAATFGKSIDKQSSLRTPNISAFHRPELAQMTIYVMAEMAKRDGTSIEKLTGKPAKALMQRALVDEDFARALASKMWTPGAIDGRKLKIGTLYKFIQENGFSAFSKQSKVAEAFDTAAEYRKKLAAANANMTVAVPAAAARGRKKHPGPRM